MEKLLINGKRNGYATEQCGETLTVGQLMEILQEYAEDTPIFLCNDGGYTYRSITEDDIYLDFVEED